MTLSWVIAGGGTGGHVTMAIALAEALQRRDQRVLVLGSQTGQADMLASGFQYKAPAPSGGGCFSISPPPDAGPGSWISFLLGLGLVAMAARAAVAGRVRVSSAG